MIRLVAYLAAAAVAGAAATSLGLAIRADDSDAGRACLDQLGENGIRTVRVTAWHDAGPRCEMWGGK